MRTDQLPQRLKVQDVADYFDCEPSTVELQASTGKLRGTKIGTSWIFKAVDVADFFDKRIDQQQEKINKKPPRITDDKQGPPSLL